MDQALVGFVRALRAAGADASPAETIDAAHALSLVGYADREALKLSLGVVLAKSLDEKRIHDRVFDQYFGVRALSSAGKKGQAQDGAQPDGAADGGDRAQGEANDGDSDNDGSSAPGQQSGPAAGGQAAPRAGGAHVDTGAPTAEAGPAPAVTGDAAVDALIQLAQGALAGEGSAGQMRLTMALQRAAQAAGVDDIRFASQVGYYTSRTLEQLPIAPLDERLRAHLLASPERRTPDEAAEMAALQGARDGLQRAARQLVEQRFELYGRGATDSFMNEVVVQRAMGRMSPPDMDRMKQVIARMAKRLAVRHGRRQRIKLQGQLDFRRTFRANAGHDSVPVDLVFKHKRRDKPRIVVVCDVSGSVATHVRFLLLFLYALHGTVTDLESFAFSDRLKDVSAPLAQLPFDDAMELILRELGNGSTDYGRAWVDLRELCWDQIDRQTTVLVLGDGRSNHADPRLDLFAELAERAMRVVWLCPEPPNRWGSGDSCMLRYRPFCTQVRHCATVADLERAIDDTLSAYS